MAMRKKGSIWFIYFISMCVFFCMKAPALNAYTEVNADLYDYVGNTLSYATSGSGAYVPPSSADLIIFNDCVDHLLQGEISEAETDCGGSGNDLYDINFKLIKFDDTEITGEELYCIQEDSAQGQSFFCINYNASKKHHISAPHPKYDSKTNIEAVEVMRGVDARFFSTATTHRCANSGTSSCSGTTTVCSSTSPKVSEAYKVSDMAHNTDSYFHHFGIKINDYDSSVITVQLHGCGSGSCPSNGDSDDIVATISAGTTSNLGTNELVNRFNSELNNLIPDGMGSSNSCSLSGDANLLCGTTNPLGRYINGETASPCDTAATTFTNSRFLHIEQNSNVRNDDGSGDTVSPDLIISALNKTLQGFSVSSVSGNTAESGTTATFTVKLDSEPDGEVTITAISSDTTEGTVLPSSLTFNPTNWSTARTITVTGVDDDVTDGNQSYSIVLALNTGSTTDTTGYISLNPDDVPVTNTDNDSVTDDTTSPKNGGSPDTCFIRSLFF